MLQVSSGPIETKPGKQTARSLPPFRLRTNGPCPLGHVLTVPAAVELHRKGMRRRFTVAHERVKFNRALPR